MDAKHVARYYFKYHFPFEAIAAFLKRNGPLAHREFAAESQLECGQPVWGRYLHCVTKSKDTSISIHALEIKQAVTQFEGRINDLRVLHIGGVYPSYPVKNVDPIGRELVIDIDATDYAHLHLLKSDLAECDASWPIVAFGLQIAESLLCDEFAYSEFLRVYSGGRGAHLYVLDEHAFHLNQETRSATVSNINLTMDKNGAAVDSILALARTHDLLDNCWSFFNKTCLKSKEDGGLGFFDEDDDVEAFFERTGCQHHGRMRELAKMACLSSRHGVARFEFLEDAVRTEFAPKDWRKSLTKAMLAMVWPRLDIKVSEGIGHVLKAPFSIHARTGRVAIPLFQNPSNFDPAKMSILASDVVNGQDAALNTFKQLVDTLIVQVVQSKRVPHPTLLEANSVQAMEVDAYDSEKEDGPMEIEVTTTKTRIPMIEVKYDITPKSWFYKMDRTFFIRAEGTKVLLFYQLSPPSDEFYGMFHATEKIVLVRDPNDSTAAKRLTDATQRIVKGTYPEQTFIRVFKDTGLFLVLNNTLLKTNQVKPEFKKLFPLFLNRRMMAGILDLHCPALPMTTHFHDMLGKHSDWMVDGLS